MSSINFNQSALVALDTLRSINKDLTAIQQQISTGKKVDNAKDNAAVWAISKVMESDVGGFMKISESLSLGISTVAVARAGAEQIEDLLQTMKENIIAAQEENQDRTKIQTDIDRLKEQIQSIVDAAQFNGVNLLNNGDTFEILASLDRSDAGLTASNIEVSRADMTFGAGTVDTAAGTFAANDVGTGITLNATQTATITIDEAIAGKAYSLSLAGTDADSSNFVPGTYTAGGALGTSDAIAYVAKEGDTEADIAAGLAQAFAAYADANGLDSSILDLSHSTGSADLVFTSGVTDGTDTIAVAVDSVVSDDNVASGALYTVDGISVVTDEDATRALETIETAIQAAIDAAAEFGSAEKRIENQTEFVSRLMDSMKSGISALTDTDMESASAKLQALQVQQQLGVQALSIANQSPQAILSLFRS